MVKIIAEVSMNFLGDISLAKEMIAAASENGTNYVKFQTWKVSNLIPGPWDLDNRREMYKKAELHKEDYYELLHYCNLYNVKFLTSCFNKDDLPFIKTISNSIKIPSPECSNKELVMSAIENFDEVFISTGSSTEEEYSSYGQYNNVYLLHCTSCYPCPRDAINMNRMLHLKKYTNNIGYSGHGEGVNDVIFAISLGAKIVEKHFTIDRKLPFRDNQFSILPDELKSIRKYADDYELMTIDKGNDFQKCEELIRNNYSRRWCGVKK
jgi:sialic acid synthase SpsE